MQNLSLKVISARIYAGLVSSGEIHDRSLEFCLRDRMDLSVHCPFECSKVRESDSSQPPLDPVKDEVVARSKIWAVAWMGEELDVVLHDKSLDNVSLVGGSPIMLQNPVACLPLRSPPASHVVAEQLKVSEILMSVDTLTSGNKLTTDHTHCIKEEHQHCFHRPLISPHFCGAGGIAGHPLHAAPLLGRIINQKPGFISGDKAGQDSWSPLDHSQVVSAEQQMPPLLSICEEVGDPATWSLLQIELLVQSGVNRSHRNATCSC